MNRSLNSEDASDALQNLPSVHEVLSTDLLRKQADLLGHNVVRDAVRLCLDRKRSLILDGADMEQLPSSDLLAEEALGLIDRRQQSVIRQVINATGILLHTGLGRAPLSDEAIAAVLQATGYCNVELDLSSANRTKRHEIVQGDLCALTGAEAAMVVNNNAGAMGLVLATFAAGREAIVSHGQLVEIGGGFRLPDVFRAYGAKLCAVGTTNRTRVADYEAAINERTGALLVVHASNYQVVGFTEQPTLSELLDLACDRDFPVVHDIGSGALVDFLGTIENKEPLVRNSVAAGAGLVLFSGDKLLGGPQAGIIVGKRHLIEQIVQHPMSRALRIDKLTLAALQATLAIYRRGESDPSAYDAIPFLRMIRTSEDQLELRATQLAERLAQLVNGWEISTARSEAYAGGGALPGNKLKSWSVVLKPISRGSDVEALAQRLRMAQPAVMCRIQHQAVYLDLRSVDPAEDELLVNAIQQTTSD